MTASHVPRLFARNERVLTLFDTAFGEFALILVGALNVGSIATVWSGDITPAARRVVTVLPPQQIALAKGAELGRFNMGSTVIILFQAQPRPLAFRHERGRDCSARSILGHSGMSWRPTATHAALARRAAMLQTTRAFFSERNVLEVETPILSAAAVSDPQIESLATQVAGMPALKFLCPSPEYAMKRLLAAGSGDIYQICKVFRDAERGRWHNPEFTMIEWYRLGVDDAALMDEVEALVRALLAPAAALGPAERLSYAAALQRHAGVDAFSSSDHELRQAARLHGIDCDAELERDAKLDLLMGLIVGPRLGARARVSSAITPLRRPHWRVCGRCIGAPRWRRASSFTSMAWNSRMDFMSWLTLGSSARASTRTWRCARARGQIAAAAG